MLPFSLAFLNYDGPGDVCTTSDGVTECTEAWNPWGWLFAGLVVLVAGGLAFRRRQHVASTRS